MKDLYFLELSGEFVVIWGEGDHFCEFPVGFLERRGP